MVNDRAKSYEIKEDGQLQSEQSEPRTGQKGPDVFKGAERNGVNGSKHKDVDDKGNYHQSNMKSIGSPENDDIDIAPRDIEMQKVAGSIESSVENGIPDDNDKPGQLSL